MAKSIEELKELTGECNKLAGKLKELSEEELEHVIGGANVNPQFLEPVLCTLGILPLIGEAKDLKVGLAKDLNKSEIRASVDELRDEHIG